MTGLRLVILASGQYTHNWTSPLQFSGFEKLHLNVYHLNTKL